MFANFFGKHQKLPHCDEIFLKYFDQWYDDDSRKRKLFKETRPDLMQAPSVIDIISNHENFFEDEFQVKYREHVALIFDSLKKDFPTFLSVKGEPDIAWVKTFDKFFDRKKINELLVASDPVDFSNKYLVITCQFGALLGYVMKMNTPRLIWFYEQPYWESMLCDPKTGYIIPPFHFAIKKMSEYGVDDDFVAKLNCLVNTLENENS